MTNFTRQAQDAQSTSSSVGLRKARELIKALQPLLATDDGRAVIDHCKLFNSYLPITRPIPVGTSFSDGHFAQTQQLRIIALTRRGIRVLTKPQLSEGSGAQLSELTFPSSAALPVIRHLRLVFTAAMIPENLLDDSVVRDHINAAASLLRSGKLTPNAMRTLWPTEK